jgi:DNA-binding MarR family transcriptional regulator
MTRSQSTIDKEELLNVARNCACSAARKLSRSLTREYDRAMKSSGLKSTQFIILVAVSLGENAQIGTLAQHLGLERTTLTRNLALLERDGLIKTTQGSDGRARIISVSAKGRAAVRSALPLWSKAQESMSDVLDVPSLIKQSNAPCGGMAQR